MSATISWSDNIFRDQLVVLNIYFDSLSFEHVEMTKAYTVLSILSKYEKYQGIYLCARKSTPSITFYIAFPRLHFTRLPEKNTSFLDFRFQYAGRRSIKILSIKRAAFSSVIIHIILISSASITVCRSYYWDPRHYIHVIPLTCRSVQRVLKREHKTIDDNVNLFRLCRWFWRYDGVMAGSQHLSSCTDGRLLYYEVYLLLLHKETQQDWCTADDFSRAYTS